MKFRFMLGAGAVTLALATAVANAAVSESEAAKLGDSLTPVGAEKAGNGGDIPAWDGGLKTPPKFDGRNYTDPFAGESPKLEITKANAAEHKDRLTPGQMAMLNKYSTYKVRVFPTHRTAIYEDKIYKAARHNATKVDLIENGNGMTEYKLAVPFPILHGTDSEKALQIMWNHITRWRGGSLQRDVVQVTPLANGDFSPVRFHEELSFVSSLQDAEKVLKEDPNVIFYFKQEITAPARLAGNVLLVHETLDQVKEPRRAWIYNQGQRRVRRAPQVAYDGPGTASDGLRTTDNFDMFNGAPDRYDWKLVGKREMYIPYNNFKLMDSSLKYSDIIKPGHINSDLTRYELHRVWVVEATLKPGQRHIYQKRVFYIDEDTWQAAVVDHYDGRGQMWRVAEGYQVVFYDVPVPWYATNALYDLLSGRYIAMDLSNEEAKPYSFTLEASSKDYTSSALRRSGH